MLKKTFFISLILIILLIFSSCNSYSETNIHELIKKINSDYGYNLSINDFQIEKKDRIIYHKITDDKSILSLYCNKNNEIIQCTLSCFDINSDVQFNLFSTIGSTLTNINIDNLKKVLDKAEVSKQINQNGWCISVIKNSLCITYVINHESAKINNNQKSTLKRSE